MCLDVLAMVSTRYPLESGWKMKEIYVYRPGSEETWVDDVFIGGVNTTDHVDGKKYNSTVTLYHSYEYI